jgi:hypothetical protein
LADPSDAAASNLEIPAEEADTGDMAAVETLSSTPSIQQQLDEALDFCEAAQEFWQKGELESALESLDKAYSLILTVEPDDPPKLVQQKEDLRFLISKRILEIYASRNIVVNGNHNAIPREINTNIQKEINRFTKGGEKRFFIESYQTFRQIPPHDPEKTGSGRPACRVILAAADRKRFQGQGTLPRPGIGNVAVHPLNGLQVRFEKRSSISTNASILKNQLMRPSPT